MDFYNNLTDNGVLFFWIVVFLVLFLLFLSIILINKNKKLRKLIEEKNTSDEDNLPISNVIEEEVKEDNTVIEKKEETIIPLEENKIEDKEEIKIEIKDEVEEEPKVDVKTSGAYQKNVLREMSRKMPISPIHIERSSIDDDTDIYTVSNDEDDYDIDEIYLREDSVSPLEQMEDSYETNDNMKFASEIISRMEEEVAPSNIELTEYERKQEEEAIISYGELEKVKDRIYNLTEEEEDGNFIDELKNFRSDL